MKRHQHRRTNEDVTARRRRDKRKERKIKLGTAYRGIIASVVLVEDVNGLPVKREYALHATKGYRCLRP